MVQSKFGRSYRHRSKPMICKKPPTAGPWIADWPPVQGNGSISWIRTDGPGFGYNAQGLITFRWVPGFRRYEGELYTPLVTINALVYQLVDRSKFGVYLQYYDAGTLQYAFYLDTIETTVGATIQSRQQTDLPGLGKTRVIFTFFATPLI